MKITGCGGGRDAGRDEGGFVLILSLLVMVTGVALGSAGLFWATQEVKVAANAADKKRSFYLADAGAEYALTFMNNQLRATTFETWFTDGANSTNAVVDGITVYTTRPGSPAAYTLNGVTMQPVIQGPSGGPYTVTVEAADRGSVSKVTASFEQFPNTAYVFDNAYFINNWGWFYGATITANGDVRSNGNFDTRGAPVINGHLYASGQIRTDGGLRGMTDFVNPKLNPNVPQLPMPNLKDLSYYEAKAIAEGGSLKCWDPAANAGAGAYKVVDAVQGDDAGEKQGLYCAGDAAHPILMSGPVVVRGDFVIKGKIDGTGSVYSGGNTYVAGSLEYVQHTGSTRPTYNGQLVDYDQIPDEEKNGNDPHGVVDGYVEQRNLNGDPLASLSARKNIIIGDYTASKDTWPSGTYLYNMGREDGVGPDGIAGTADDTTPNGRMDPGEDIDEDGVLRTTNYSYAADVATNLATIDNLPAGAASYWQLVGAGIGAIASKNDIVTPATLEAVFYTNHAVAGRLGLNAVINGAMISKDEAIYYSNKLDFNFDERIHSRYLGLAGSVDLDLPKILTIGVREWKSE